MRTINIAVKGEIIKKDSKNAGVRGDANATELRFTFGEEWSGYSKRINWVDAMGENPVAVILYNSVEDLVNGTDPMTYTTYIPAEAMRAEGWCSFTVEGYKAETPEAIAFSATEYLWVADTDRDYIPEDVTPSQAQQLQAMIEGITEETAAIVAEAQKNLEDAQKDISVWEEWDETKEYVPLNKVVASGSSYVCVTANVGINPGADIDGNYWLLIAAKGERGERGLDGRDGQPGRDGAIGPAGTDGINGIAVAADGIVAFNVDENGDLWCSYTGNTVPNYYLGDDGCLYVRI